ncbi:MOSC domain-containing protein [Rhizobium sp. KVB221]|uniref:MOSC domain-containing protein n=1 Tax=Rhizobium setariae TaxID=2801340 RepID=A0A936YQ89_9HYPH|nr:MOSC domain-containing protein [Rhizobium setariae]MBL0370572.1 MOSC domain-containing protein [Rhizobium setariae]
MKVKSLHIYPLKSGRVIDLDSAAITAWGLSGDRRYMLVDPDGRCITQREVQPLAQVTAVAKDGVLTLSKVGEPQPILASFDTDRRMNVEIWDSKVTAAVALDGVNHALSKWFGIPVLLVHADEITDRQCSPDWAGASVSTGFADGYPILVTTTGSLKALNEATLAAGDEGFGMDRFRPNVVIEDDAPFADDRWAAIEIGGIRYDLVKPCARCIMTTQDQLTGERGGPDPMPAMRKLRMSADRRVSGVLFGWNAVPRTIGALQVGDSVSVLEQRPEGWPLKQR